MARVCCGGIGAPDASGQVQANSRVPPFLGFNRSGRTSKVDCPAPGWRIPPNRSDQCSQRVQASSMVTPMEGGPFTIEANVALPMQLRRIGCVFTTENRDSRPKFLRSPGRCLCICKTCSLPPRPGRARGRQDLPPRLPASKDRYWAGPGGWLLFGWPGDLGSWLLRSPVSTTGFSR